MSCDRNPRGEERQWPEKAATFAEWMQSVDEYFVGRCGMSASDLPDAPWRDWFDAGYTPEEAWEDYAENWDDTGMMQEL